MSGILETIERMLSTSEQTEITMMKLNIVRVLTVYKGTSWKTELLVDLAKFLRFLGQPDIIEPRIVDEALDSLLSDEVITIEDRARGAMLENRVYIDQLIHLNELAKVKDALRKDPAFTRYMQDRDKMIRDAVSKQS
jgi:hypothetical protein